MLGGQYQALLLVGVNAGGRAAEAIAAALAYLGKDQGFLVAQNQVYFPEAAVVIALNQRQAVSLQILCCELFGLGARLH